MNRWWTRGVPFRAEFIRCRHGDCIEVCPRGGGASICGVAVVRLARIHDPDDRHGPGNGHTAAATVLGALLAGRALTVIPRRSWPDPYGRIVAEVLVDGLNVSNELVRLGLCVRWRAGVRRRSPS